VKVGQFEYGEGLKGGYSNPAFKHLTAAFSDFGDIFSA
jgi:hypothetical protein